MRSQIARLERRFPSIARRTGIAIERLYLLASGEEPSLQELLALSKYLRIPIDGLQDYERDIGKSTMRLRATSRPEMFYAAEARVNLICNFVLSNVTDEESYSIHLEAGTNSRRSIEDAAMATRHLFQINEDAAEIPDIVHSISKSNVSHVIKLRNFGIDGASATIKGVSFIFVSAQYLPRMRYTIAHELAHIVFGHCAAAPILDQHVERFEGGVIDDERLANSFASSLLMPAIGVARFLDSYRKIFEISDDSISSVEISYLSRYFGVSFEVAGNRLEQLNIVDSGVTAALMREIRRRHSSPESYMKSLPAKPNYSMVPVLSPGLKSTIRNKIEGGEISIGRLANILGYSVGEAYEFVR